jgi:hypothetical protein
MISTKLQGGLGNQMFQISVAYALAKENNDTFGFDFDDCYTPQQGKTSNHYRDNIFKNIPEIKNYRFKFGYTEPKHSFTKIPYTSDLVLNGSFQSEKYFLNYIDDIKNLFILTDINDYLNSLDKNFTYTSVHFRRGDYLKPQFVNFHSVCDTDYYNKAMSKIPNSKFILLSDDMDWVKNNFKGENIIYSPFTTELEDLSLMVNCQNNIISNSTFSWWGAYLNPNQNKVVIGPKKWFGPIGHKDTQDVLPESWIKI